MSTNELDKLYSPSCWSKRFSSPKDVINHHLSFIKKAGKAAREIIPHELNVKYGNSEREYFNIFGTDLPDDAPIFVFIHGGYWQIKELGRESYEFISVNLHKNQIKSVFIGYDLCPDVTIFEIPKQIEKAIAKCLDYAKAKESKGIYLAGHSAGAHLAAYLFTGDLEKRLFKAVFLISGVFDLTPIQKSVVNQHLKMDEEMAEKLSPARLKIEKNINCRFICIVGENESPEFVKQSREFNAFLENFGFDSQFLIVPDVDHFDIIEKLGDEYFMLNGVIVSVINDKE